MLFPGSQAIGARQECGKPHEIISLFSNLKNNRWELDKYYELIDYYIREQYFELVPQLQYSDSAYVTLPQRMDSQASTVSKNAAAMFSKQILSLDEESIRLNFDKEALRFSKELKPMFALLARGLSEILRVYLKDESRGFLNTISEAANYLICEGTVGVACFLDEIRGSFVLDVIPPHNLYYTAQLGSSPEQIFCRAEMTGTQLMKQYAAEGLTPETKYKVIYYYRPVIYDFKDVLATLTPEMQKNWRLSLIILDTQKVIYEHNFANRPIYIARSNSFNRSQYGTGAGISALTAVISKNEALYWTKTHEIMTIYPPIVINALLK